MREMYYALTLLVVLTACAAPTGQVVREEPMKIGGLFGLTGYASFAGESSRDGFLLAISESDIPIDYVIEDYQSDMKTTVSAARKLIDVDDIEVIIGPEWEFGAVAAPLAGEALFITPWLTIDPAWTEPELFMSMMPTSQANSDYLAAFLKQEGIETVVILRSQDDYALTLERMVTSAFEEQGIEILSVFVTDVASSDYRTQLLKTQELAPDAIYSVLATDDAQARLVRQFRELGIKGMLLTDYPRAESDGFLVAAGNAAENLTFVSTAVPARADEFKEKFRAHFGRDPIAPSAATAYDATKLVIEAYKSGARTAQEVQDFLGDVEAYDGYSGKITFEDGFVAGGESVIKQVRDGKRVVIA